MKKIYKLSAGCFTARLFNALPLTMLKGLLTVFLLMLSFNVLHAGSITGQTPVCVGSTWTYCYTPVPSGSSAFYWHVSSGGSFSPGGDCINVTWNVAGTDSIWVNVYDNTTCSLIDSAFMLVTVNPLPLPGIFTLSNQSCVTLRASNPKDPALLQQMTQLSLNQIYAVNNLATTGTNGQKGNDTCYLVCDSTQQIFFADFLAGATYTWSVTGAPGDTISTSVGPPNVYTVNWGGTLGYATVNLVITTAAGCSDSTSRCVDVIQKPHCEFYGDTVACGGTLNICKDQTVTFTDSSIASSSSGINSWLWDFGDNTTSTNADPTHQYTVAGTYIVKLIVTNHCGCKDSCELKVVVDSTTGPNIYCITTICAGDTGYYWTDAICSSYVWSVTGGTILGDSTRDTIRVVWGNGNSGPGIISLTTPCTIYCPYSSYVTVPIVPVNGIIYGPTIVCMDYSTTIKYHMNCIPGTLYNWSLTTNPARGFISNSSTGPDIGIIWYGPPGWDTIQVSYFNSLLNCGGTAFLPVYITTPFTLFGPTEACAGDTSQYYTNPPGVFKWIVYDDFTNLAIATGSGPTFSQIWPNVTTVSNYTVFAIDTLGVFCNSPQFITVTVFPLPPTPGPISGITCVCPNESYTYSATPTAGNYYLLWTVINGTPSTAVGSSINVTWGAAGPYVLLLQQGMIASPHCPSLADTDTVFVCPALVGNITGTSSECINQIETYTFPSGANNYNWSIGSLGTLISGQGTNTVTIEYGNFIGITIIHLSYTLCGVTYNVSLSDTVTPAPVPIIILPSTLCQNTPLTFTTSAFSGGSPQYIWTIVGGPTTTTSVGSFTYTFTLPGTYTLDLTVVDINNCHENGTTAVTFTINPTPAAYISTPDPLVTCNLPDTFYVTVTSSGCVGATTYQWYGPSGALGTGTIQLSGTTYPNAYGAYYCVVTNSCVCSATTNILTLDTCGIPPPCSLSITPSVSFTETQNCGTVNFTSSHSAPGFIPGSYYWNFGDGIGTSNAQNPVYSYAHPGYYLVEFCCSYTDGIDTCSICFDSPDTIPFIPNFTVTYSCSGSGPILTTITYNGQTVAPYVVASDMWTGAITGGSSSSVSAYLIAGSYNETETVTVTGNSQTYTCPITLPFIVPIQPNANFTYGPIPDCTGTPVDFTNTSTNPSAIIQYNWLFGTLPPSGSNLTNPDHNYIVGGTLPQIFPVTLTINDEYGCTSSVTKNVTVYPNTVSIIMTPNNGEACEGDSIIIFANAHSLFGPLAYSWIPCGHYTAYDTVTQTGYYTVIVTDSKGCSAIDSTQETFLDIPTPNISGTQDYCNLDNVNLSMYVGPGYTYIWTISSAATGTSTVTSSDLNGNTYPNPLYNYNPWPHPPYPYIVHAYISVNTPISCVDSAVDTIWVHFPPPNPTISASDTCLLNAPLILTAYDSNSSVIFTWSNGGNGNTISVINSGIFMVSARDSFGCSSQSNPFVVPALPDFCNLFTGCICDTGNQIIMAPNEPGYHVVQWLRNGLPYPNTVAFPNLLITQSGTYQLVMESNLLTNCPVTSGYIYVDDCTPALCCCCDSSVVYFKSLVCIGIDSSGNEQYQYDIYYDYTGTSPTPYTVTVGPPNNGTLSGMTSGTLNPGINSISGIFTDIPPVGYNFCLEIIHGDSATGGSCKQEVCSQLPPCDSLPPCNQKVCVCDDCGGIICGGDDQNGNPIYKIYFYINYSGNNNSTFYISTAEGVFTSLSSNIVNNGFNQYSVMFVNLPPWQGYMCMNVVIRDSVTGIVCEQQYCFALPECPIAPCQTKPVMEGPLTECIGVDSTGHKEWFIQMLVYDPFICCGQSVAAVTSTGFISNQTPTTLTGSPTDVRFHYTNYSTDSTVACFRFIITDSSGAQCMDSICIQLPPCQKPNDKLEESFNLQPNPAKNQVVINYTFIQAGDNEIVFRDARGVEMGRVRANGTSGSLTYDLSAISSGVYQVSSENNGKQIQTLRLIITK